MSDQEKSQVKWNWAAARLIQPDTEKAALQNYYQERYGDKKLTISIKAARRNLRKQKYEENREPA